MEDLDVEPKLEELSKAIDSLASGKASGTDGMPQTSSRAARPPFYNHYMTPSGCQHVGDVPQDMTDAKIIILYTNKEDKSDCNNYRGISLLSNVGKVYTKVVLACLLQMAEHVYPKCGFHAERSTVDMIFSRRSARNKRNPSTSPS